MALLFPQVGEAAVLNTLLNKVAVEDLVIKLYSNNYTPLDGSVAGDFTETTFTGYVDVELVPADWAVTPGNPTVAIHDQVIFTSTAGSQSVPVYGYYVVGATSGALKWAERFPAGPYTVENDGHEIRITPRIQI